MTITSRMVRKIATMKGLALYPSFKNRLEDLRALFWIANYRQLVVILSQAHDRGRKCRIPLPPSVHLKDLLKDLMIQNRNTFAALPQLPSATQQPFPPIISKSPACIFWCNIRFWKVDEKNIEARQRLRHRGTERWSDWRIKNKGNKNSEVEVS